MQSFARQIYVSNWGKQNINKKLLSTFIGLFIPIMRGLNE